MCGKYNVKWNEYLDINNKKNDIVGLITAVCENCDLENCAKNDGSRTIFLLDEAVTYSKDGVCDYTPLTDLCRLKTVYTATCINPRILNLDATCFDKGDMSPLKQTNTMKLPVACSFPCDKGHSHGCIFSAKFLHCYRNSTEIRKLMQFWNDHCGGLLSHQDDKMGANLPPRLAGQHSAVTWVQCYSQENMEKAARDTVDMLVKDKEKDVVILYNNEDVMASDIVRKVQGNYRAVYFMDYFGCEADICLYPTNGLIQIEMLSRPRRGLFVITGPDLNYYYQSFMKAAAGDHHSQTLGGVECLNIPCPWNCGHVSPVAHHVSLVAHTVSSTCLWTPLVQHKAVSSACGHIMERTRDNCQQCGEKYVESVVLARAAVKPKMNVFVKNIMRCPVTDTEVDDLLAINAIVDATRQLSTALEGNDKQLKLTLQKQLKDLIVTNSPSIVRAAVKQKLKDFIEKIMKIPMTDKEVEDLFAINAIVDVTQQLSTALEGKDEELKSTLLKQLKDLLTANSPSIARAAVKQKLNNFIEEIMESPVTDKELEDLISIDEIFNVTQQLSIALEGNDEELESTLTKQLKDLLTTNSPSIARAAVKQKLNDFIEKIMKSPITDKEVEDLFAITAIVDVTQQLFTALGDGDEELKSTLAEELKDLLTTNSPSIARAAVKQELNKFIKKIINHPVPEKEVEDLLAIDAIVNMTRQLSIALQGDDKELKLTLHKQLKDLLASNSPSIARAAVKETLKLFIVMNFKSPLTDKEVEDLLTIDAIVNMTQQRSAALEGDDMELKSTLWKQLKDLISTNSPTIVRAAMKQKLKLFIQKIKKSPVTDRELEDLLAINAIVNATQQWSAALEGDDKELKSTLRKQLVRLLNVNSPSIARAAVKQKLNDFIEEIMESPVTDKELEDLLSIDAIFNVTQKLSTASEGNDEELESNLTKELEDLLTINSTSIARAAVKETMKLFIEMIMKSPVTDKEVEDLLAVNAIFNVTQQLSTALEGDDNELKSTLRKQLVGLLSANSPSIARAAVRENLKLFIEKIMKSTVTDKELEDLLTINVIFNVTQQLYTALAGDDEELKSNLRKQLKYLIATTHPA